MKTSVCLGLAPLLAVCCLPGEGRAEDAPWLYGIHWYGRIDSDDVEQMTGGKGVYVLDQVLTHTGDGGGGNNWDSAEAKRQPWSTLVSRGHTLIARIHPNWGRAVPEPGDEYSLDRFAADCEDAARTLRDVCHIWQLGNEMNLYLEYQEKALPADWYVTVYHAVRDAIHRVKSPLGPQIVLVGPVSPGPVIEDVRWMHGSDYLAAMLQHLEPDRTDGFALHSYGGQVPLPEALREFRDGLTEQIALIDGAGYADRPLYLTEWNRSSQDDESLAISARFLHENFAWLHEWNQTPGNHNIIGACWFIYPKASEWNIYSILASKRPGGTADTDLWHAFQYAAAQDYPAGCVGVRSATATPLKLH